MHATVPELADMGVAWCLTYGLYRPIPTCRRRAKARANRLR